MKKNENYRDFSNRRPYNDIPCKKGEILMPVVLSDEMKETLKPFGLNLENAETWRFPYAKERVIVVFIQVPEEQREAAMKVFNQDVRRFLGRYDKDEWDELLSIDKFMEDAEDDEKVGFYPTEYTISGDYELAQLMIQELIAEVTMTNPKYGEVLEMLVADLDKGDIIKELKLGKSQGYDLIKKAQAFAKEVYNR